MKFKNINKLNEGAYITRYDITYETKAGGEKVYEMISRDKNIKDQGGLLKEGADAVVLIIHDESGEKILLNREYRMAAGRWVYNFPAGLIEPGESPQESAERELWEETGLKLLHIDDWMFESYSAVGFSNEKNVCVVGTAAGTFAESTDPTEEIKAGWYTKEAVGSLLKDQHFAARTQAYCYLWSRQ
ncbi:ADP-ribose pyrophosphatase [uncultured Roseburia sp.]|uniref:NUDIX hydrolase n=1 Tax=Brotonthovivens ammoniilytica TaxID=2981725 RepID=A0ABT2TJJ2_9FIRM|nr:NUDIX hydrolase [Brotonthovivens ammoniilytica]MCU6761807.1 NUDIX hydrolase [Brotonthovivens ammoniilytica]SCI47277.1 ADP-ribose pyrophosphatase [uncultured Roseburia sp.]